MLDILARGAPTLLLSLACCAHAAAPHLPQLVAGGDLHGACRLMEHCASAPDNCPELSQPEARQSARGALLRALAVREQLTVRLGVLDRKQLTQRLGFESAPSFPERGLTLALTVASSAPEVHAEVEDFRVEGLPELLSAGDEGEELERYVAALGGPLRPPFVPLPGTKPEVSDLVKLLAHVATMGVFLAFELGGGPRLSPDASYIDAKGRRVDWMSWFDLPEVRAAGALRQPRWKLRIDENVPVPLGGPVTITRGYTFLPWRSEVAQNTNLYHYAWRTSTRAARAVAISAAGWLGVISGSYLTVLDGASGRSLATVEVCEVVEDGLFLVAPARGIVVCRDELAELGFPNMKLGATASLSFEAEVAALGGALVAVGGGRHVQLHRTSSLARIEAIELPVEISSLALSPDDQRLAIGGKDGSTRIRLVGGGPEIIRQGDSDSRVRALAFSPDGRRLFVGDGHFSAQELDVTTGKAVGLQHRTGSWLTAARYLADDLVAATGSDGLMLYPIGTTNGHPLVDPKTVESGSARGLGVSPDGRMVCAGDHMGRTICHARGQIGASTLFDAWKPDEPPALVVDLRFELPGDDGGCKIGGAYRFDLRSAGSPREAIEALAARGEIPLASADHIW